MKNSIGQNVTVTVFGESHGAGIGAVLDGMPAGIPVNDEFIKHQLSLRRPSGDISTPRIEADNFIIYSGVYNGFTTGTPLCIVIPNENTISKDYEADRFLARPSHADYVAYEKYNGFEDYRGGGHFSGRVTTGLVAVGAVAITALKQKGIKIGTHISKCAGINDAAFSDLEAEIDALNNMQFAVLDDKKALEMQNAIKAARADCDSVGGVLETAVIGMPVGVGEPWFDTLEGLLSHALFSIPAIKGVEFGLGFNIADLKGSQANDPFEISKGKVITKTNNNGGINGGISNGMPIVFRSAVKPTPTIAKEQNTINFKENEAAILKAAGRHDPCIIHRARVVVDSMVAITLCDALTAKFGTDWWL
ncbi:MAG: chorismate synthase [Clostridia bacterium]|nr:chorismate synthase [Clostridia bacterium]